VRKRESTQPVAAADGDRFTIGEAARRTGLTRKAVRLYEARGLLPPVERTGTGYRRYSEHDLRALRFIRQARGLGLSLDQIHTIMALRRTGVPPNEDVIALLRTRLGEIERRVSDLQSLRDALADTLEVVTSRAQRGENVRLCRVLDPGR
jgi:MerR family copper efflux transcriptional regulator